MLMLYVMLGDYMSIIYLFKPKSSAYVNTLNTQLNIYPSSSFIMLKYVVYI